jgi:hypothetical protein
MQKVSDLIPIMESSDLWTWCKMYASNRKGSVEIYTDDKANDTRRVLKFEVEYPFISVQEMHGWNEDKQRWDKYGRNYQIKLNGLRGLKK